MRARLDGLSVVGGGIAGWNEAQAILRGERTWQEAPLSVPAPAILSPNERRRASPFVRMALSAAEEASERAGRDRARLDCIFASAIGDGKVAHAVLRALTTADRAVSPTQFHNSVHNAVAGYWSIGTGNHEAATSLAAGDGTFGGALLKALMTVAVEGRAVELVAVEHAFPEPLNAKRPIGVPLCVAMVLGPPEGDPAPPGSGESGERWEIAMTGTGPGPASTPRREGLEGLWASGPVGRALPLLERLFDPGSVTVEVGADYFLTLDVRAR